MLVAGVGRPHNLTLRRDCHDVVCGGVLRGGVLRCAQCFMASGDVSCHTTIEGSYWYKAYATHTIESLIYSENRPGPLLVPYKSYPCSSYIMPISAKGETHPHSAKPERWSSSHLLPCGQISTPA